MRKLHYLIRRLQRVKTPRTHRLIYSLKKRIRKHSYSLRDIHDCKLEKTFPSSSDPSATACEVIEAPPTLSTRIINGKSCTALLSPVVKVDALTASGRTFSSCSGTIIAPQLVLTAAHCFPGFTSSVKIHIGSLEYTASSFTRHPEFSLFIDPFELNDLAILTFAEVLPTKTISLLKENNLQTGERTIIAGYGRDENNEIGSLKAGDMNVYTSDIVSITAQYTGVDSNTCIGDSGGPLLVYRDNTWVLAGTTSTGDLADCGLGDIARFTNITDPSNQSFLQEFLPLND